MAGVVLRHIARAPKLTKITLSTYHYFALFFFFFNKPRTKKKLKMSLRKNNVVADQCKSDFEFWANESTSFSGREIFKIET